MQVSIVFILFVIIIAAVACEINIYVVLAIIALFMYSGEIKLCDTVTIQREKLSQQRDIITPAVNFTKPSTHIHPPEVIVPQPPVQFTSTVRELPAYDKDIYGPYYAQWNEQRKVYTDSYLEPQPRVGVSCAERQYDVDAAGALLAQKRTVDRQRNDGWAAKNADYYRYHFAEELDTEENLRWWGREEI